MTKSAKKSASSVKGTMKKPANKKDSQNKIWRKIRGQPRDSSEIPNAIKLAKQTLIFVRVQWKPLLGIVAIYLILTYLLAHSDTINLNEINSDIEGVFGGDASKIIKALTAAGIAVSLEGQTSEVASLYGTIFTIMFALATIWAVRRLSQNKHLKIRDAFYNGMFPVIPFVIVLLIISLQLIPFAIGSFLYATVKTNGIVVSIWEELLFIGIWLVCALLSAYWLAVSVNGLFAVTLPGMYPWRALREAKALVKHRRWVVFRKMIFAPLLLLALGFAFLVLVVYFVPSLAILAIELIKAIGLLIVIVYLFKLYRSML